MQTIASTYVRTPQGRAAAFGPATKLPQQLKTLLQAVDGKTASSVLSAQFAALGNTTQLLSQLEIAGLIEDKTKMERNTPFRQGADEIWGAPRGSHAKPALHIVANSGAASASMQRLLATPLPHADAWQPTAAAGLDDSTPARSLETILVDLTQQVVDVMATFVLTYLPDQAFHVLTELETLRSPAQLKATLPSYESLARSAGQAGRQHIAELQQLMERQFVSAY
jgi:hypothetical protein